MALLKSSITIFGGLHGTFISIKIKISGSKVIQSMATKLPAKKTNLDIHAECEVAASILAECFAYFAKRLAAEKQLETPNQNKIDALEKQLSELYDAKLELDIDKPEIIYKALHIWAPLLRKCDP